MKRRGVLGMLSIGSGWAWGQTPDAPADATPRAGRALAFPQDFGAHPGARTEWWYLTGELRSKQEPERPLGFQVTFFRTRVDAGAGNPSRFAPRQLLLAHTALSDTARGQLLHDQRTARMGFGIVEASEGDTEARLRDWFLRRSGPPAQSVYETRVVARGYTLELSCRQTQPLLLQGEQGFSRKAPQAAYATHYYSQPQLAVSGRLSYRQQELEVSGHAWLDHEWGERILAPGAVGWDWFGMNLQDGSAFMAFRTRRADGSAVWLAASLRRPGQPDRIFKPEEISLTPRQHWQSPASNARYPIEWALRLGTASYLVRARMPNQELDGRLSTGSFYWEGLCDLLSAQGQQLGSGYLEMTGYATAMDI